MIAKTDGSGPAIFPIGLPPGFPRFPRLARRLRLLGLFLSPAVLAIGGDRRACWLGSCRSALVALATRRTCVRRAGFCNRGLLRGFRSRRPWCRRAISARAFLSQDRWRSLIAVMTILAGSGLGADVRRSAGRPAAACLAPATGRRSCTAPATAATALAAVGDVLGAGRIADPGHGDAQHLLDVLELLDVLGRDEGQRAPFLAGAAGAADAVHVVVGLPGHVEVEDVADVGDVEAAGGHVARRQQA